MKKILAMIALLLMCMATTASAEFSEYSVYYDFEDYDVEYGQGIGPDGSWGFASMKSGQNYVPSEKRKNFGSATDSETGSKVMSAKGYGKAGEPVLKFGELKSEGKFHISFDLKLVSNDGEAYIGFYDGTNALTGGTEMVESNYAIGPWFKKDGKIYYSYSGQKNGNDMRWTQHWKPVVNSGLTSEIGKWHHIDMYFEDYGDVNSALAYYYIDGNLINENPVYFKTSNGFKGLYFRTSGNTEIYIDNLYVKNFKGEEPLVGVLENDLVEREDSKLRIRLIEPASAVITKEDIIITNNQDGTEITDFEVTSDSERIIDIKINSGLGTGRYTVKLKDTVVGAYYGNTMKDGLVFRTPPKTVDGVECPDVEGIEYYLFGGIKQNDKTGISTATEKIEIKFTNTISDANIEEAVILKKGEEEKTYAWELKDDAKTLVLYPIGLLDPASDYNLTVTTDISAAENAEAKMESEIVEEFSTLDDAKFEIKTDGIIKDSDTATFPVRIIKTNTEEHKYSYAAAAYKKHTVTDAEGNMKIYYEMTAINRFPVVTEEQEKGFFEFDCSTPLDIKGANVVKGFLWNYPENTIVLEK